MLHTKFLHVQLLYYILPKLFFGKIHYTVVNKFILHVLIVTILDIVDKFVFLNKRATLVLGQSSYLH